MPVGEPAPTEAMHSQGARMRALHSADCTPGFSVGVAHSIFRSDRTLKAERVERHADDEKDSTCIVHLDLSPKKPAHYSCVGDHFSEQRVNCGLDKVVLKGVNWYI
jgi:hypothetical protein